MSLTLAEAAKLSNDVLLKGVVETIIKDSPVLQRLPFQTLTKATVEGLFCFGRNIRIVEIVIGIRVEHTISKDRRRNSHRQPKQELH